MRSAPDNRAAWDQIAAPYQEHVGWPDEALTWGFRCPPERELRILGDVAGKRTLVLGCGGGQDVAALARMGAGELTGLDISDEQLAHARDRLRAMGREASFVRGDAADLGAFADASFDLVVSVQALNYVEDLDRCFGEVHRVLVGGGYLAFSVLHGVDVSTEDAPPYGFKRSYFQREVDWEWDGLTERAVSLRSWFPTVAAWFAALTGAGFTVERIEEPRPVEDRTWIELGWLDEASYAKLDVVPSTLIFGARRT